MGRRRPSSPAASVEAREHGRARRRWTPLGALVGALLVLTGAPGASAAATACPGADTAFASISQAQAEWSVVCLGNAARAAVGQAPLAADSRLGLAARRHAQDMDDRHYFDHQAPSPAPFGVDVSARVNATRYPFRLVGENLASGQETPRAVVTAWLRSPGHCDNLLDPGFVEIGVGRAKQARVWVQVLGNRSDPGRTAPHPGCDSGAPPSVDDVVAAPPADPPKTATSGLKLVGLTRSGAQWTVTLKGAHAAGRTATAGVYGEQRECVVQTGKPKHCSTVPGKRLATRKATLASSTKLHLPRRPGEAFAQITLPAFERGGVRYAATTLTRKLPR